jgi:hypothetical protein
LLNNMDQFKGGELEIMMMDKRKAIRGLEEGTIKKEDRDVIGYENSGKMILAQGSEILHHVTPVLTDRRRQGYTLALK